MNWDEAVSAISPHVFRIKTPIGMGTGFLIHYSDFDPVCCVATADHVVDDPDDPNPPITLFHPHTDEELFLESNERHIIRHPETDSAVILFSRPVFPLPDTTLPLFSYKEYLPLGTQIGWLGFPGLAIDTQCFFSGHVSAYDKERGRYLVSVQKR